MAKKILQQKKSVVSKRGESFEWLARMVKEGFNDVRVEIRESENRLRKEIRESEENLQYRISNVTTGVFRHLDTKIEPKIAAHERRIKRLEHREPAQI